MKNIVRYFFRFVRLVTGPVILFLDYITTPKGITRAAERQAEIDLDTQNLVLYQFRTCPFCIKVRRAIKRLSLNIEIRDAQHNTANREALLEGGGTVKVPCLRITSGDGDVQWLYESDDIIAYLQQRYA